jgi:serine/threonine-protein kinase
MELDRWEQIERLYHAALERGPDAREAFLDESCAGDEDLRREVAWLLACDVPGDSFIQSPAIEIAARAMAAEPLIEASTNSMWNLIAGSQIGAYRLIEPLGRGGMGEVHLALDTRLGRKVALKLLPAAFTTDASRVQRFAREARAASALNHPNIITIHEVGETETENGNLRYIVTEYVEGETLRQRLRDAPQRRMKPSEAIDISLQIAAALAAAHEAGITHRDIKPENIMVRPDGLVKVLDFGLAKLTNPPVETIDTGAMTMSREMETTPGMILGTLCYLSPEQARAREVDARSDIFSLGAVLYEMIAGEPLFAGETTADIIAAIINKEPEPLAGFTREPSLSGAEMDRIARKALRKDREERYQSAGDMFSDLKDLKEELTIGDRGLRIVEESALVDNNNGSSTGHDHSVHPGSSSRRHIESKALAKRPGRRLLAGAAIVIGLGVIIGFYVYKRISRPDPVQSRAAAFRALAILPFQPLGMPADEEYLGLGLTDSLITELSHYEGLVVRPSSAINKFQTPGSDPFHAGRELGVDLALTGKIQREGPRLRVTMQLIQVNTETILWSDKFDGQKSEMFALQDSISRKVAETLMRQFPGRIALKQHPGGHRENYQPKNQAHLAYLNGRYHIYSYTRDGWEKSRGYLTEATKIDPHYALAHASLAEAYTIAAELYLSPLEAWPQAQAAAERAIALDGNLAEAYTSLAIVKALHQRDWEGAEHAFEQATALDPQLATTRDWYGWILLWQGRFDESLDQLREAQRLDPFSPSIGTDIGTFFYCINKYDQAETELKKLLERDADSFSVISMLGWVYIKQERIAEAVAAFEKARKLDNTPWTVAQLAHAHARAGNRAAAERLLAELRQRSNNEYVSPFAFVYVYLGLDDKEQTFAWLERSYEIQSADMITLKVDPIFDPLRSDPRFRDLLRRLNLSG